jgi:uncharacterized membrane protein (UPF0182 family)
VAFRAPGQPRSARRPVAMPRWPRRLVPAAVTAVLAIIAVGVLAGVWTNLLWFQSVGHVGTFAVTFGTQWALFAVAAVFMAGVIGGNAWLAYRLRPARLPLPPSGGSPEQPGPEAYRQLLDPHRRLAMAALVGLTGLIAGTTAAGRWRTWLLFANRTSFGRTDPLFHLDISFFVFDYPLIRLVLAYLFAAVLLSVAVAAGVHYLYGGLTFRLRGRLATDAARVHLFALAGAFVLLKAAAYWVDRYGIDLAQRDDVQTGASYTGVNAILPAKTVLAVIALICALLFLVGAARRSTMLPAIGLGLFVLSAILLGGVYPAIVQQFVVKPNELAKEAPYLAREITGTRLAYGVNQARVINYSATSSQTPSELASEAAALPDLRLADPGVLSPAFQQLQQVKSYYQFPSVLSVDRYQVPGDPAGEDMIIGVRAMRGPPAAQASWVNTHLVYTHGYGVVAATASATAANGSPAFTERDIPATANGLGLFRPQEYFGEQENNYVIVGGRGQRELDYPADQSSGGQQDSTYHGAGGVPVGSLLGRLLFAIKFRELNILLSGAIDGRSRIMYTRTPLAMVAKVAPFLTLDRDVYPVVAGGQLDWVVDGYTTTGDYPDSARLGAEQATADTYEPGGGLVNGPAQLNYLRDSVKAVVNAYTGQVTLYQWGRADPLLAAWEKAFPGLIRPGNAIPAGLRAHLRYPEALFGLQREVLTQFHVTDAADFYGGQDFWSVPGDPASAPGGASGGASGGRLSQPPYYLTMIMPGPATPRFSLLTTFTQRGRRNLAALMAVDSQPGPGYGRLEILQLPQNTGIDGPQQVHGAFEADTSASGDLSLWRKGGSTVTFGNLVTVPLGGGLLSTQPLYVSSSAAGSYPALKRVFAYFDGQVGYAPTLQGALAQVLGTGTGTAPAPPGSVLRYLQEAETYYAEAQAALPRSFAAFGADLAKMNAALKQAEKVAAGSAPGQGRP